MSGVGIYIHIPFCLRKCAYCDFLSYDTGYDPGVIDGIEKEIRLYSRVLERYNADTVFIGGGTPSFIPAEDIGRILKALAVTEDCEITLELNPGTATEEKLDFYKSAGINRLSIGLQSADNSELKTLGRIHTLEVFLETYSRARKAGFDNINIDIMFGLPGQTQNSWIRTLDRVLSLNPEHISAYSLILEKGTKLYSMERELFPGEEAEREMYHLLLDTLKGYGHYEISNFAKPGKKCRHNLKYWTMKEYIGFGPGAHSFYRKGRYENESDMEIYKQKLDRGIPPVASSEQEDYEELKKDFIITGFRLIEGISFKEYKDMFHSDFLKEYQERMEKYSRLGLITVTEQGARFTRAGILVSNAVLADLI